MKRGDVVLVYYPFASGVGGSRRPGVVIQNDVYHRRIRNTIVAQITTNLRHSNDPAHLLIADGSAEGRQAGLLHDSLVSSVNLVTVTDDRIDKVIGTLGPLLMLKVNVCLKLSLAIP